eukprot:3567422-Prymnesium_polylepis.1
MAGSPGRRLAPVRWCRGRPWRLGSCKLSGLGRGWRHAPLCWWGRASGGAGDGGGVLGDAAQSSPGRFGLGWVGGPCGTSGCGVHAEICHMPIWLTVP